MNEDYRLNNPKERNEQYFIDQSLQNNKFSLETIFSMIADMGGPRAIYKIEEVILDTKNSFYKLEKVFESTKDILGEELRHRAIISLFKRPDCKQEFIDKYSKEAFPGVKEKKGK